MGNLCSECGCWAPCQAQSQLYCRRAIACAAPLRFLRQAGMEPTQTSRPLWEVWWGGAGGLREFSEAKQFLGTCIFFKLRVNCMY